MTINERCGVVSIYCALNKKVPRSIKTDLIYIYRFTEYKYTAELPKMTTWNNSPYPPPQNPNQGYYGGQPQPGGYPAPHQQPPYPGAGYPNAPPSYPGPVPPQGYPGGPGAPPYGPGATPYGQEQHYGQPAGGAGYMQQGERTPLSHKFDMYGTSYPEDPDVKGFGFSDKTIRRGFIQKVYAILMAQLLITCAIISFFMFHDGARRFVRANSWLIFVAFGVLFVAMIALACCGEVRRKSPANYILLGLFTLAESFMLAVCASQYQVNEVLMAVGITAVICLALTLFAFQTRWDFTMCGGFLFICVIVLMVFGLIASIMAATGNGSKVVSLVYASLGALLFSIYLIYDTQLMMGGKHKYSISPEEYIFAALNLYVDIINIFLYILTIIGASRD
ncbi:hypothetical protein FQR65_LT05695 [Abscondita terminalis]|nr:hypothetical protein FQR65_LT05695 [Abscondita terminalis]